VRPDPVPGCGRRSPRWRYRSWGWQPVPRARVVQRAGDRNRRPGPTSTRGTCVHPHRVDRRHHAWAGSAAMSSSARACPIVAVVARSSLRRVASTYGTRPAPRATPVASSTGRMPRPVVTQPTGTPAAKARATMTAGDLHRGREGHRIGDASRRAPLSVVGPRRRQMHLAVGYGVSFWRTGRPGRPPPGSSRSGRRRPGTVGPPPAERMPLFTKAGVVDDQHTVGVAEMLDHIVPYVVSDRVDAPKSARRTRRCIPSGDTSPACSANVHPFLRSRRETSPHRCPPRPPARPHPTKP